MRPSIFLAAVTVRLLAFWLTPEPELSYNAAFAYLRGAQMLVEGQGFWDPSFPVYTPPFYSLCIAILTFLFGDGIVAIKLLQIVADSITAVMISLIVREVFDNSAGNLSAIVWAFYPFAVYPTLYIGTEALFTFFIALWIWITVCAIKNDKWQYQCCAGVVLGLATLTRGSTQFLPFVLPILVFACKEQRFEWLRAYLLFLACFIAVILPWGARNYLVLHEIIPVAANSMPVLMGSSERLLTIGETRDNEMSRLYEESEAKGIVPVSPDRGPTEREGYLMRLAVYNYLEQLRAQPFNLMLFMIKKLFRLWYSTESGHNHSFVLGVNLLIYLPAIVGLVVGWRRNRCITMLFVVLIGYFVLLHWLTLAIFRFMIPIMPFVIVFAALGLLMQLERHWPKTYQRFLEMPRQKMK